MAGKLAAAHGRVMVTHITWTTKWISKTATRSMETVLASRLIPVRCIQKSFLTSRGFVRNAA